MATAPSTTKTLRLHVPGLIERPAVGTGCCASTAEAIVAQELSMLPGIDEITIDCPTGHVQVTYQPAAVSQNDIEAALEEIGYPPKPR
jgi:copper chaperone CopZ